MLPNKPEFDQSLAAMRDFLPRAWWAIYQGSIQSGFNPAQAFALLTTYILKDGRISPDNPPLTEIKEE